MKMALNETKRKRTKMYEVVLSWDLLYMKGNENPLSEHFTFYTMTSYKIKDNDKGWSGIELLHYIIYYKMKGQ